MHIYKAFGELSGIDGKARENREKIEALAQENYALKQQRKRLRTTAIIELALDFQRELRDSGNQYFTSRRNFSHPFLVHVNRNPGRWRRKAINERHNLAIEAFNAAWDELNTVFKEEFKSLTTDQVYSYVSGMGLKNLPENRVKPENKKTRQIKVDTST